MIEYKYVEEIMSSEWIMVIITSVYVIATVFICIANFKSASASKQQLNESHRQFEEENRAYVVVDFDVIRSGFLALRITNQGKRIAKNVKIRINKEFMEHYKTISDAKDLQRLCDSTFSLGIGQTFYTFIEVHTVIEKLSEKLLSVNIEYSDFNGHYSDDIILDLKQYFWMLIYESPTEDSYQELKKISKSMNSIILLQKNK